MMKETRNILSVVSLMKICSRNILKVDKFAIDFGMQLTLFLRGHREARKILGIS